MQSFFFMWPSSASIAVSTTLALLVVSVRAGATCASSRGYHATVTGSHVEVLLEVDEYWNGHSLTVVRCPGASSADRPMLRTNVDTGQVVRVDGCNAEGAFVDDCVAPGHYRYGLSQPNQNDAPKYFTGLSLQCSSGDCYTQLYTDVVVESVLPPSCTSESGAPTPVTARPWTDCPDYCEYMEVWKCSKPWPAADADADTPFDASAGADADTPFDASADADADTPFDASANADADTPFDTGANAPFDAGADASEDPLVVARAEAGGFPSNTGNETGTEERTGGHDGDASAPLLDAKGGTPGPGEHDEPLTDQGTSSSNSAVTSGGCGLAPGGTRNPAAPLLGFALLAQAVFARRRNRAIS